MAHTPGPWRWLSEAPNPACVRVARNLPLQERVWAAADWYDGWEDDARLIAAAPDLLAALETLSYEFNRMPDAGLVKGDPRYAWWFETYEARQAARAAIAKAT